MINIITQLIAIYLIFFRGVSCIKPIVPMELINMRKQGSRYNLAVLFMDFQAFHQNNEQLGILFLVDEKEIMEKAAEKRKRLEEATHRKKSLEKAARKIKSLKKAAHRLGRLGKAIQNMKSLEKAAESLQCSEGATDKLPTLEEAMKDAVQQHMAAVQQYTNNNKRPPYIYVVATPATYKLAVELFSPYGSHRNSNGSLDIVFIRENMLPGTDNTTHSCKTQNEVTLERPLGNGSILNTIGKHEDFKYIDYLNIRSIARTDASMPFTEAASLIRPWPYEIALSTYPIDDTREYQIFYRDENYKVAVTKYTPNMPIRGYNSSHFYEDTCNYTFSAAFIRKFINIKVKPKTGPKSMVDNTAEPVHISLHKDILYAFKLTVRFHMLVLNRGEDNELIQA